MDKVRVVIICDYDELISVYVDDKQKVDISSIRGSKIEDWFKGSDSRNGWKGLITEIKEKIGDEKAGLDFEFFGPDEVKEKFEMCIQGRGYVLKKWPKEKEAEIYLAEARRFEDREDYKEAFMLYKMAADYQESAEAEYIVAEHYHEHYEKKENGVEDSSEECINNAIEYYRRAAEKNHKEAQYRLYKWLSSEDRENPDWKEAAKWLKKSAENGHIQAQINLGNCYVTERLYFEGHKELAVQWYEKAAENNNIEAIMRLVDCYKNGHGVEENKGKVFGWYQRAAESGSAEAWYELGKCYQNGYGVLLSHEKAVPCYQKAAEMGIVEAQCELADCYYFGIGVRKNLTEAVKYYTEAAKQENGCAKAEVQLGLCYEHGYGVQEDQKEAFSWYLKAAQHGNVDAQFYVGSRYKDEKGVECNLEEAAKWMEEAAKQGNLDAMCELGILYQEGKGVERNPSKGLGWHRRAAEEGHARAQCLMGLNYENGNGVEKDLFKAYVWYEKSSMNGYKNAMYHLGRCYEYGRGVKKDIDIAFVWYKKGAIIEPAEVRCCMKIGDYYYEAFKRADSSWKKRTGALVAASVLVPVTNFVTIPVALTGSFVRNVIKKGKFMKTDAGKEMMKYYQKAAELGNEDAKKKVEELKSYT